MTDFARNVLRYLDGNDNDRDALHSLLRTQALEAIIDGLSLELMEARQLLGVAESRRREAEEQAQITIDINQSMYRMEQRALQAEAALRAFGAYDETTTKEGV